MGTFRRSFKRREGGAVPCKCDDPHITHYTKDGHCVVPGCGCTEFRPKGRPEFSNIKRAKCEYQHDHKSGLEIKECADLHYLRLAKQIKDFKYEPCIDLPGPSGHIVATYKVDFEVAHLDGSTEFVECKGGHLENDKSWRIKWALLQDKHYRDRKYKFRVRIG